MGGKQYTQEHKNWLKANAPFHTYPELVKMFNDEFGQNRSETGIERICRDKLGIKHASTYGYSEEEDAWLIDNAPNHSCTTLSEMMFERFGVFHTPGSLKQHCRESLAIKKGHGFQYDTTHPNKLPIGSSTKHSGRWYVKVAETPNASSNFKLLGRWIYEQAYGKLPNGYQVVHLNGDADDFSLDNLKAVSQQAHCQLAVNGLFGLGELTSVAIDCYELDMIIKGFK